MIKISFYDELKNLLPAHFEVAILSLTRRSVCSQRNLDAPTGSDSEYSINLVANMSAMN